MHLPNKEKEAKMVRFSRGVAVASGLVAMLIDSPVVSAQGSSKR